MCKIVRYMFCLVFATVICFSVTSEKVLHAQITSDESQLFYLIKNEDALLQARQTALNQLLERPSAELYDAILAAFQKKPKTDQSKLFRIYLEERIAQAKDLAFIGLLATKLRDKMEKASFRENALRLLFNIDTEKIKPLAYHIVNDRKEIESLRLAALNGLAFHAADKTTIDLADALARDRSESFKMRLTALTFLESRADPKSYENIFDIYKRIISNPRETPRLQVLLITRGAGSDIPNLNETLLAVMRDSKFDVTVRTAALQSLVQDETMASALLDELKHRSLTEKGPFREEVKAVLDRLLSEKTTSSLAISNPARQESVE